MFKVRGLKKLVLIVLIILIIFVVFLVKKNSPPIYGYYCQREGELPSSFRSTFLHSSTLKGVAFFWYQCGEDGTVASAEETDLDMLKYLQSKGIETYAVVHNLHQGQFNRRIAERILTDEKIADQLIDNIVKTVAEQGYSGVNLDLENISPELRDNLSDFSARLKSKLQGENKMLFIAVPAKQWDDKNNQWSGAFDYRALARYADQLILMAYEEHGLTSGPGSIASLPWVEQVVRYALSQCSADKIILGIPVYGFLWSNRKDGLPQYLSYGQLKKLAKQKQVSIQWDGVLKTPYFTYQEGGLLFSAWFENKKSFSSKLKLAKKYKLGGIALWRLGMEDPDIWNKLK
jgi:spore germination protein